jgi:hypothetical protein
VATAVASREVPTQAPAVPVISFQPAGVRKRGRGVAYEWSLPTVLEFVEKGIELKRAQQTLQGEIYILAYGGVRLRTLEMVRRWLLKGERAGQQIIEVASRGTPDERYDLGVYMTVAGWFARFIHDGLYQSVYCPRCRKSYPKGRLKFVILGLCPSGRRGQTQRARALTGETCPKGHLLIRHGLEVGQTGPVCILSSSGLLEDGLMQHEQYAANVAYLCMVAHTVGQATEETSAWRVAGKCPAAGQSVPGNAGLRCGCDARGLAWVRGQPFSPSPGIPCCPQQPRRWRKRLPRPL